MKRHLFVILFGFLGVQGFSQTMHTLGAEILGQSTSEEIGETIDFSSDGSTYIISSNSYGSGQGRVAVLELTEDDYSLKGSPIVGSTNERIGLDVSVDGDGSVIAFSSNRGSLLGTNGFVRVYAWNGSSWVQRGSDLTEGTEGYGSRVKISAGGNIVAVSAPFENSQTGAVYVYEFDGSDWVQVGNSFTSSASYSGFTLDMSDDGTRVALGHNSGNGAVAIYQNLSNTWSLMGSEITGSSASGDYFGARLSLSGDGSTIAIGAYSHSTTSTNRGMVEVFEWDSNTTSWIQKGSTIEGSGTGALLGFSLDLNTTGDVMVIAESGTGYAYLVNYSTTWGGLSTQSITTVSSDGFTGSSGEGLALIGSGYRYAVGLRRKDNGAIVDAGAVQVYSYGYEESTNDVLCPATVYSFGSQSLTSGGNYIEMMASSEGYDSLVYLTLTENDLAIAGVSTNSTNNLCFGDANGTISITANSGSTPYEYSIGGAYQSSNTFTGLSAGTYTASVRDAEGCVVSQTGITITEPAQLGLNLAQTQPVSCDGDTDGSLTVSAIGGTSPYTYSLDGTNFQPSGSFDNLTNATYDIYARDANSCTALIHSTAISVNDTQNPVITSANTASFDDGGSGTAYLVEATDNCAVTMYSITGGADASLFTINSTTGAVAFVASPDYSNPQDFDKDNVYAIEVEAEDFSGNVASLSVNISVEDIVLAGFAYTWTGATSSDWNDASNWDIGIPGLGSNIIIEPVGNQPVIPSASIVRTQDLAVVSGANLTLESGGTLQVNGSLVGNGTYTVKRNTTGNLGYSIVGSPRNHEQTNHIQHSKFRIYAAADGAKCTTRHTYRRRTFPPLSSRWSLRREETLR